MYLAPSVFPNNIEADFIPVSTIIVSWSTVLFSNGEITNYTIQFSIAGGFSDSVVVVENNTRYISQRFTDSSSPIVNVVVTASNQYGDGPASPVKRVSTDGMIA